MAADDRPTQTSVAPATGAPLGAVPVASQADVLAAVAEARAVQGLWAQLRLADRARYMARAAQAVIDESDELAALIGAEQGRPRTEVELGVSSADGAVEIWANAVRLARLDGHRRAGFLDRDRPGSSHRRQSVSTSARTGNARICRRAVRWA